MGKTALVLGGGAPTYTLMTGALLAFDEAGVEFDVVSMAGGGGVVGLTYLAPRGMSRQEALRASVNYGVSDALYNLFPMNFKMFTKGGAPAAIYRQMLASMPGYEAILAQAQKGPAQAFFSDAIQFAWSALMPGNLSLFSEGFCAPAQFIDRMVDFDAVRRVPQSVYLNAYCLTDKKMAIFSKDEIDLPHFQASLSYPFFYAPFDIDGKQYIEGASRDTFNFQALLTHEPEVDTIIVINAIANDSLLHPPTTLWDAFGQQLITPLVALAHADLKLFAYEAAQGPTPRQVKIVNFDISDALAPTALDWSRSNLHAMFEIGYQTGQHFIETHGPRFDKA